jgi:hypothetical protein
MKKTIQMANKHVKRCSVLSAIREMHMKITVRYHYIRIAKTEKRTSPDTGRDTEKLHYSYIAGENVKWCDHSGICLKKLNMNDHSAQQLHSWGIYSSKCKLCSHTHLHMNATRVFLILGPNWKLATCASRDEWLNKLWYIQNNAQQLKETSSF